MQQTLQCPECQAHLAWPYGAAEQVVQCIRCQHVFAPAPPKQVAKGMPMVAPSVDRSAWDDLPSLVRPIPPRGGTLAKVAMTLLAISMLAYGAQLYFHVEHLLLLEQPRPLVVLVHKRPDPLEARWDNWEQCSQIARLFHHVTFWPAMIVFLLWLNRAFQNLRNLAAQGMSFRPVAAMMSFFLPVFNLFGPCLAMQELWRASEPDLVRTPKAWENAPNSRLVLCWWSCLLFSTGLYFLANCISSGDWAPVEDQCLAEMLMCLSRMVVLVEGTLLILIIRAIVQRQGDRFERLIDAPIGLAAQG
jgi:hypothetical protein